MRKHLRAALTDPDSVASEIETPAIPELISLEKHGAQRKNVGRVSAPLIGALTEEQAATYLNISRSFLRQSRMNGNRPGHAPGPRFMRVGRMVRYPLKWLDRYIEDHAVEASAVPNADVHR